MIAYIVLRLSAICKFTVQIHTHTPVGKTLQAVEEEARRRRLAMQFSPGRDHADASIQDYKVRAVYDMVQ
jgi:hypothetical protein